MMTKTADRPETRSPALGRVLAVWGITALLAAGAIFALRHYQNNLIEWIAYTDAPPAQKAAFLSERADLLFEELRRSHEGAGPGALAGDPEALEVLEYYKKSLEFSGGRAPSEAIYEKLAALYSWLGRTDEMYQAQAQAFIHEGDFRAAVDAAAHCTSIEGRVLYGQAQIEAGMVDEAAALAQELRAEQPSHPEVLFLQADVLAKRAREARADGEIEGAHDLWRRSSELLQRVVDLQPSRIPVYVQLAEQYRLIGDFESSVRTLSRAIEAQPNDAMLYHLRGRILLESGEPAEAARSIERAIDLRPNEVALYLDLRQAYNEAGQAAKAEEALQRAVALDSDYVNRTLGR